MTVATLDFGFFRFLVDHRLGELLVQRLIARHRGDARGAWHLIGKRFAVRSDRVRRLDLIWIQSDRVAQFFVLTHFPYSLADTATPVCRRRVSPGVP